MAEKAPKIYVGNGKSKFNGDLISVSINLDKIPDEHINEFNGKRFVRLNVALNYEGKVDEYGNTHSVTIDTWKPSTAKNEDRGDYKPAPAKSPLAVVEDENSLPF